MRSSLIFIYVYIYLELPSARISLWCNPNCNILDKTTPGEFLGDFLTYIPSFGNLIPPVCWNAFTFYDLIPTFNSSNANKLV